MTEVALSFKTRQQYTEWPELAAVWAEADKLEVYRGGWLLDHFTPLFDDRPGPVLEPWSLLGALAAHTSRLRLGVMVSGVTHRHPALLAAMAATIDRVSGGRLDVGLGAAWHAEEHRKLGMPFPPPGERISRLGEACVVIDALLRGEGMPVAGTYYALPADGGLSVRPVQRPRPPFTIGGRGEKRTLRTVARWADMWNLPAGDPGVLAHKLAVLRGHCEAVGRDPAAVEISVQVPGADPGRCAEASAALVEAGARHIVAWFAPPFDLQALGAVPAALERAGLRPSGLPRPAVAG